MATYIMLSAIVVKTLTYDEKKKKKVHRMREFFVPCELVPIEEDLWTGRSAGIMTAILARKCTTHPFYPCIFWGDDPTELVFFNNASIGHRMLYKYQCRPIQDLEFKAVALKLNETFVRSKEFLLWGVVHPVTLEHVTGLHTWDQKPVKYPVRALEPGNMFLYSITC